MTSQCTKDEKCANVRTPGADFFTGLIFEAMEFESMTFRANAVSDNWQFEQMVFRHTTFQANGFRVFAPSPSYLIFILI